MVYECSPKLKRWRQHVTMNRNMMLQDDIKEYWGFYLLKGSIVKLSVCSRHEGASFIVVRGLKDARKCSYLGELDSQEESDEISEEFEFAHHITEELNLVKNVTQALLAPPESEENGAVLFKKFLSDFQKANISNKRSMLWQMMQSIRQDPKSEEALNDVKQKFAAFRVKILSFSKHFVSPSRFIEFHSALSQFLRRTNIAAKKSNKLW